MTLALIIDEVDSGLEMNFLILLKHACEMDEMTPQVDETKLFYIL